jgi:hypothetical protein
MIAKRIRRGAENSSFGKPKPAHVIAALQAGASRLRADPVRRAEALQKQRAAMTPEKMAGSIAGLRAVEANPERVRQRETTRLATTRTPVARQRVADWSRQNWAERREVIIAAQNAGKGADWKRQQSENKQREWADPNAGHQRAAIAKRRVSDADLEQIRRLRAEGQTQSELAKRFGVTPSRISRLLAGKRRAFDPS